MVPATIREGFGANRAGKLDFGGLWRRPRRGGGNAAPRWRSGQRLLC